MHAAIAGPEPVALGLSGVGAAAADGLAAAEAAIAEALDRAAAEESRRRMVLCGPHRDDLVLTVDGRPARAFASQGQARSLVLALKLAELEAARRRGEAPLFLLDDLTSELDARRMRRLVALLAELPNQVWITTTDPGWLGPLPGGDARILRVEAGSVRASPSVDEGPPPG
jgi:DNA replication and repair protein RecF